MHPSWRRRSMPNVFQTHSVEMRLSLVLLLIVVGLSIKTDTFMTLGNITSLLNNNAVNLIWAVGLLVVLVAGGIDISFAVAASGRAISFSSRLRGVRRRQLGRGFRRCSGFRGWAWSDQCVIDSWVSSDFYCNHHRHF